MKPKTFEEFVIEVVREYYKEWVRVHGNDEGWIEGLMDIIEEGLEKEGK